MDDSVGFQNFGATALFHVTKFLRVGGTIGRRSCPQCDGVVFASADAEVPLFRQTNVERGAGYMSIALHGSAGLARYDTTKLSARSIGALLPVSVSLPQVEDGLVTIFVAPGFAYGALTDDAGTVLGNVGTAAGTHALISAGIGYVLPFGLGVHATVHRILINASPSHVGVAVSWRFGSQPRR